MFQRDGDQHTGRTGRFAFSLLPTAESPESDSEEIGEAFLGEVEGMADLGNLALGCLSLAEIFRFVLGVEVETEDAMIVGDSVANHMRTAPFSPALGGPAGVAAATGTGNNVAGVGLLRPIHPDCEDPIVTDQAECFFVEIGIFLKGHIEILRMISQRERSY